MAADRTTPLPALRWTLLPVLLLVLLASGCDGDSPHATSAASPAIAFRNHETGVAYVGREACRDCHAEIHASFARTGMGRSFDDMSDAVAVESFEGDNTFHLASVDVSYRMERRDDGYYQRQFVLDSAGNELIAEERRMRYVVGSNNHNRAYLHQEDGKLYQTPVCWYPQASRWDMCPGFEHNNDNFSRETSASCMFCHNGRMTPLEGQRNAFHEPFPRGIGCERCHGPGELHLRRWNAEQPAPLEDRDDTIVHPRWLEPEARLHVCAQCHLGDAKQTERVKRDGTDLLDFRPGQRRTDSVMPFRYSRPAQADFGLSSQVDRLVLSRCFLQAEGRLDCLTCHDPHVSIYSASRPADYFRRKCLSCHAGEDCAGPQHGRDATPGVADDCVACHMRKAEPDDQRFTEFTDHWIRRSVDVQHTPRTDFSIEPTFPAALARLDPGEQAFLWARAYYLFAEKTPPARESLYADAEARFREAIDAGFDRPDAWYFLGKTYWLQQRIDEAVAAFEQVLARDAGHHDGNFAYGQLLGARGELERARGVFEGMLRRKPDDAMALAELGRVRFALGDREQALAAYRQAVRIEPMNPLLQLNLGMTYAGLGRMEEAAQAGFRVAGLEPDSAGTWSFFHNVMRETGRKHEAAEGLKRARRFGAE